MFQATENVYFGRCPDGAVRIIKFRQVPVTWPAVNRNYSDAEVEFDYTVPEGVWPSIVATVSLAGEEQGRYYAARAFHHNPPVVHEALITKGAWDGIKKRKDELDDRTAPLQPIKATPVNSYKQRDCLFHYCPYPEKCKQRKDGCMHTEDRAKGR